MAGVHTTPDNNSLRFLAVPGTFASICFVAVGSDLSPFQGVSPSEQYRIAPRLTAFHRGSVSLLRAFLPAKVGLYRSGQTGVRPCLIGTEPGGTDPGSGCFWID